MTYCKSFLCPFAMRVIVFEKCGYGLPKQSAHPDFHYGQNTL